MQRFCFRVEAGVAVEACDTLGTDEERKPRCEHPALLLSALLR
jgi:hypothetical protein